MEHGATVYATARISVHAVWGYSVPVFYMARHSTGFPSNQTKRIPPTCWALSRATEPAQQWPCYVVVSVSDNVFLLVYISICKTNHISGLMATIQHTRTRKAYGIRGDVGSDCIRATCCTCCTLIQDETDIKKREEDRAKVAAAQGATLASPYIPPVQMSYPPPPR